MTRKEKVFYQPTIMSMSYQGRVFQIKHCCFVKCLHRVELPETIVSVPLSCTPFPGTPSVGKRRSEQQDGGCRRLSRMVGADGFEEPHVGCELSALSHEANGAKSWDSGSVAPSVAVFLGPSPLMNTVAHTAVFTSVTIPPSTPPFTSLLVSSSKLESLTKTHGCFLDL